LKGGAEAASSPVLAWGQPAGRCVAPAVATGSMCVHPCRLEWIIIILIFIELVVGLVQLAGMLGWVPEAR